MKPANVPSHSVMDADDRHSFPTRELCLKAAWVPFSRVHVRPSLRLSVCCPLAQPLGPTLSMSSCLTGKEKVKPKGSFLCFIWCLSRKSEMHSEM